MQSPPLRQLHTPRQELPPLHDAKRSALRAASSPQSRATPAQTSQAQSRPLHIHKLPDSIPPCDSSSALPQTLHTQSSGHPAPEPSYLRLPPRASKARCKSRPVGAPTDGASSVG